MQDYARTILQRLAEKDPIRSTELEIPAAEIHGVLLSLQSREQVRFTIEECIERVLTPEGQDAVEQGSPEYRLYSSIPAEGADASILDAHPIGNRHAFRNRWIKNNDGRVVRAVADAADSTAQALGRLHLLDEKEFIELKKRNLAQQKKTNVYVITRGERFGEQEEAEAELTAGMVQNFKDQKFKRYNFNSTGNIPQCGALHPLMKIREEFKRIFVEMGFSEMQTNRYVESSFWNFDSLFQPQNHPARDAHDTFFLGRPAQTTAFDEAYLARVRRMHSEGGNGSIGHSANWSLEEASKNILRTHTTSISSRYLQRMASDFHPTKLFSIDKVFRNESIDATHLAEFHQVEGLIAGYDLGIGDLIGILSVFFEKLGLRNIKFKPAFNPYTEPSMEVFGYHEGLGRWIEIGNSGIFRPEMLGPMGYPDDVCVIAWGLSLERPAMIKYGLNNIRDLVGHRVDINFIKKSEFVFLGK